MEEERTRKRSTSAMFLLFAEGCFFLLISTAVLACGFVLNFHDNFDADKVDAEVDYSQYWVGITFLITSFVAIAAGVNQNSGWLVVTTVFLLLASIFVSLFVLVVEGNDWVQHKTAVRRKDFWGSEDYTCNSVMSTCVCTNSQTQDTKVISNEIDCEMLRRLNYIYGGIVCCVLVGVFLALSSIIIIMILIPLPHFTIPEPKKRIKKITVLEEKEPKPKREVVYQPKKIDKPEVEEIVVRAVRPLERKRTVVYDEPILQPRPQPRPQPPRVLVPIEPPPEPRPREQIHHVESMERRVTQRVVSHVYDEGRLVRQPRASPPRQPTVVVERNYVRNPNFVSSNSEPAQMVVRREERVIRQRPVEYVEQPRVPQERRLVPVERSFVYKKKSPREYTAERPREYVFERPRMYTVQRPRMHTHVQTRPRAYSDEGQRLFVQERPRVYTGERTRVFSEEVPRVVGQGRPRAYSDERPRVYTGAAKPRLFTEQDVAQSAVPARPLVYTVPAGSSVPAGSTVPAGASISAATAHLPPPNAQGYDTKLENTLQPANTWEARPPTPY